MSTDEQVEHKRRAEPPNDPRAETRRTRHDQRNSLLQRGGASSSASARS